MLEFEEFVELSAKFLTEEDEESLKQELKEAFRIYDKEGESRISIFNERAIHKRAYFHILQRSFAISHCSMINTFIHDGFLQFIEDDDSCDLLHNFG